MAALSKSGRGERAAFAGHPRVRKRPGGAGLGGLREQRCLAVRGRWPAAPAAPARAESLQPPPGACRLLAAAGAERAPEEGPAEGLGLGARSFSLAASVPASTSDV